MSKQIGFDRLFDAQSFDAGTTQLVKYLNRITEEIDKAKDSAIQFAKIMGAELKKEIAQLSSTSANLAKKMQEITQKMNDFKVATSNTKKVISDYEKENEKLRKELENLKKAQQDVTNTTKNKSQVMGQLRQSLLGVASGATILYKGIEILKNQLQLAVTSTIEFEQAMKEVQAISRASSEQLANLTANANKLGASTEKTAVEIAKLQKELAKLGFTSTEIIASSQAIVDLSTATGEDLAGSATVAAATLRAFGLEASEMTRVVDVMAGSFVRSGLDLEKFRESMKLVAPIARATGVDIEVTTAALSKLADAGLSGSLAGTALRNLLSSMADPSEKLTKFLGNLNVELADGVKSSDDLVLAFKELKASGIDLATAVQMVDVRARPAFFTLLNQADSVEALAKEYRSLTGEGHRIAEMMRDTLANDIEIMNSAFDALRRNLTENGVPAMREVVQETTALIEAFRLLSKGTVELDGVLGMYVNHMKNVFSAVGDTWSVIFEVLDKLTGYSDNMREMAKASEELKFTEMMDEASSSIKIFNESVKMVEMKDLLDQFNELKSKKELTAQESQRLAKIEMSLVSAFGETAYAVNRATGEVFINTEAIERSITSKVKEAETTRDVLKARIEEIDATITLNRASITSNRLSEDHSIALSTEIEVLDENNKLLREKEILLKAINTEYGTLVDDSINGWSVLTQAGLEAASATKSWADATEDAKKAAEELLKAKQKLREETQKEVKEIVDLVKKDFDARIERVKNAQETADEISKVPAKIQSDWESAYDELFKEDEQFAENQLKNLEKFEKAKEKAREKEIKAEQEKWDKTIELAQLAAEALSNITRSIFDNRQIQRDNELNKIDEWEQEKLRLAGDNEEAKLAIQQKAEEQRREIAKKQAQDNKKEAMFQIAISTAVAVMRTLEKGAGFFSTPLAIAVAALGAAQLAMVAARPLPQFAKGTKDSPEGFAEVGERGRELIRDGRTGQWSLTPDKSTVTYLSKHSQVIPNAQTEQILKADPNIMADNYLKNKIIEVKAPQVDYDRIGQKFEQAVSKIPINMTNFDERGVTNYVVKRSVRLQRLNKRY